MQARSSKAEVACLKRVPLSRNNLCCSRRGFNLIERNIAFRRTWIFTPKEALDTRTGLGYGDP